ncbi:MAG: peroxiredoxin [Fulvivirga sp.]|nr:peroxiredoxin [Fulvivirga sp.]
MLSENQQAPDFTLPSTSGEDFTLSKSAKNKPIVIYFYPKDNTRVCTLEACAFRDRFDHLRALDIEVVGISTDSIKKHLNFKKEHHLPFELLSDRNGKVSKLYRAYVPIIGISQRITYLLDKEHRVKLAIKDHFNASKHLKAVIEESTKL